MIGPTIAVLQALSPELTVHEALSGIFGSISLATWIFVLVPQLILNYRNGNAEGLSLAFVTVWLFGDATNFAGAIWAHLVPTVVVLAAYFCLADVVLISQCLYYNKLTARYKKNQDDHHRGRRTAGGPTHPSEQSPLLSGSGSTSQERAESRERSKSLRKGSQRRTSISNRGLPGSIRRLSSTDGALHRTLTKDWEAPETAEENSWLRNFFSILAIIAVGTAGWAIAWQSGAWRPVPDPGHEAHGEEVAVGASILGYISAVAYLVARTPQIYKNYVDKSCEGLALLFFLLSLMGNLTYGLSILCHSLEKDYILTNLPWLIGSLGTIAEDVIIFVQFKMYSTKEDDIAVV
ncbi:PQ loop repeat-domain-containing protein [Bisporella sp. PMI_857]|nr:PQ loop repeat-domain-containing protein [Bisporella sp. PMI_857]